MPTADEEDLSISGQWILSGGELEGIGKSFGGDLTTGNGPGSMSSFFDSTDRSRWPVQGKPPSLYASPALHAGIGRGV
jgi:hypothetical protein